MAYLARWCVKLCAEFLKSTTDSGANLDLFCTALSRIRFLNANRLYIYKFPDAMMAQLASVT